MRLNMCLLAVPWRRSERNRAIRAPSAAVDVMAGVTEQAGTETTKTTEIVITKRKKETEIIRMNDNEDEVEAAANH